VRPGLAVLVPLLMTAGIAGALEGPEVDLKPTRKIWIMNAGACSVDVSFRLEVKDGGDERYYCPEVEWQWPDDTRSVSESDCPPFDEAEEGRRFVQRKSHPFTRSGQWTVVVRLSKAGELIHEAKTTVLITGYEGMSDDERAAHCH